MSTVVQSERLVDEEVRVTYEKLGLGTMESRAQFVDFRPREPRMQFDIVISNTSEPFRT